MSANTRFENFVEQELAHYADGDGDMVHGVLDRIQERWIRMFGELPESDWRWMQA